jgi:hypothetical protein
MKRAMSHNAQPSSLHPDAGIISKREVATSRSQMSIPASLVANKSYEWE